MNNDDYLISDGCVHMKLDTHTGDRLLCALYLSVQNDGHKIHITMSNLLKREDLIMQEMVHYAFLPLIQIFATLRQIYNGSMETIIPDNTGFKNVAGREVPKQEYMDQTSHVKHILY
jgi:hypothetical protein